MLYSIFVHSGITIYWCTTVFNFTYLADLALSSCCTPFLCTVVSKLAHTAGKHQIKIRHKITDFFSRYHFQNRQQGNVIICLLVMIFSSSCIALFNVYITFFLNRVFALFIIYQSENLVFGIILCMRNINFGMSIQNQYTYNIYIFSHMNRSPGIYNWAPPQESFDK